MSLDDIQTKRDSEGFIVLDRTYTELYKKANYLTQETVVSNRIYEYDIRSANTSSLRASGKIDPKMLDLLEHMDKQSREETIGKMERQQAKDRSSKKRDIKDSDMIYKIIQKQIMKSREKLCRMNGLTDHDILAIKNDAVFVIGKRLEYTKFGPIEFKEKNRYSFYENIDKIEFYYDKRHDILDIKGINKDVVSHPDHQQGMMIFFKHVFNLAMKDRQDELRKYLIDFTHDYKARELPVQYYRELNGLNIYRTIAEFSGFEYNLTTIGQDNISIVNPIYNFTKFILPVIRQYM